MTPRQIGSGWDRLECVPPPNIRGGPAGATLLREALRPRCTLESPREALSIGWPPAGSD